ncbi:hypothetical protein Tco_1009871 [Tanacetum coccineum]
MFKDNRIKIKGTLLGEMVQQVLEVHIVELGMLMQVRESLSSVITQPKRPQNSDYFKDMMLLMQAQENVAVLDEEELLFLVGEQPNTFDADVETNLSGIWLGMKTTFSRQVPDLENANVASNNDQVEHEIHSEVQQSTIIDSNNVDMGNSNVIPYEQYLTTNDVSVVPSCASSAPNTAYVLIDNNVHTPNEPLVTELAIDNLKDTLDTLCEIVEEARSELPSDSNLDYACVYTKRSQELLANASASCPKAVNKRDKFIATTPVKKKHPRHIMPCGFTILFALTNWTPTSIGDPIPATPEPAWSIPSSILPVPINNWASVIAFSYVPPPENSLLSQTGDIGGFIDWFCKKQGITEITTKHLEGPAYEVVKAFHLDAEHKNQSMGGPPGQVTIQTEFFFNKDLEYLRFGSKGDRLALSITKIKAAHYPNAGLKQMRQKFYIDRHSAENNRRAIVRTHMRILSVVRIEVFSIYGSPEPPTAKGQEDSLYYCQLMGQECGYQKKGLEFMHDYKILDSPRAILFRDKYGMQMLMRFNEIHKFGTRIDVTKCKQFIYLRIRRWLKSSGSSGFGKLCWVEEYEKEGTTRLLRRDPNDDIFSVALVLLVSDTDAGNPVKEILLKIEST